MRAPAWVTVPVRAMSSQVRVDSIGAVSQSRAGIWSRGVVWVARQVPSSSRAVSSTRTDQVAGAVTCHGTSASRWAARALSAIVPAAAACAVSRHPARGRPTVAPAA